MCLVGLIVSLHLCTMFVLGMLGIVLIRKQKGSKHIAKTLFD